MREGGERRWGEGGGGRDTDGRMDTMLNGEGNRTVAEGTSDGRTERKKDRHTDATTVAKQ